MSWRRQLWLLVKRSVLIAGVYMALSVGLLFVTGGGVAAVSSPAWSWTLLRVGCFEAGVFIFRFALWLRRKGRAKYALRPAPRLPGMVAMELSCGHFASAPDSVIVQAEHLRRCFALHEQVSCFKCGKPGRIQSVRHYEDQARA